MAFFLQRYLAFQVGTASIFRWCAFGARGTPSSGTPGTARPKAAQKVLLEALQHTPEGLEGSWPSSWPRLKGSAKQVTWADSIRARTVGLLAEELVMGWLPEVRGVPVVRWLALQTSAAFWIHCRFLDTLAVVLMYERESGSPGKARRWGTDGLSGTDATAT
jgi:hypothetical protein